MVTEEKLAAILEKAEALVGNPLGAYGEDLTAIAAALACAWCNRDDIPEDMEGVVAAMTASLAGGRETVKAVTRGDTSVSYDTSGGMAGLASLAALAPWRRLGRLKEE